MCSRKWIIVALVACGLASACSEYNTNLSIQTSSSTLTFVSPQTATAGGGGFTITANGTGYISGAIILWNSTQLTTTFVSATQLTAPVPASLIATPGTVQVAIDIPGSAVPGATNPNNGNSTTTTEISNIVFFTIGTTPGPAPAITKLSASTTSQASTPYCSAAGLTLTVTGTNFTSDAIVNWNGSARATTFVSATQLTTAILATDTAFSGSAAVTVSNSLGTSTSLPVTMLTPATALPAPSISALSQSSVAAGSPALPLTVTGGNILPCSVVQWVNGSNVTTTLPTTYISATQLTAAVPAADFVSAGTAQVTVFTLAPGGGTSSALAFTISPPAITSLSASTTSGASTPSCSAAGFTITVNGTNFVNTSAVNWNDSPRVTTFVSATQLTAAISALDIAAQGTAVITVSTGPVLSAPVNFSVSAPGALATPAITSLSQANATAGTAAFTLTVTGNNFLPCSVVQWNGGNRATSYLGATQLTAAITAADIAAVGTAQVAVSTPATGGATSNAISFPIVAPTITSLSASTTSSASTPACSSLGITLTVNGTNFANGVVVNWNGSPRPTTFVSATQLTAAITATDTAFSGPVNITVSSSTTTSLSSPFTMTAPTTPLPVPVITTLLPANATAGAAAFMLTVDATSANGGSLVPCSVVNWNGSPRTTTFIGTTGVNAAISAADVANSGPAQVTVTNPTAGGGGGTSNALTFTIFSTAAGTVSSSARIASLAQTASASSGSVTSSTVSDGSLPAPTMTPDNRYAVFVLASTDGVTETPGTPENIFVRDTCTGAPAGCTPSVSLTSIGFNSNPADGDSISPSISADGRYVVYISSATNLVVSDTNGVADVFVRDTCAGVASGCAPSTQRVSVASDGTQFIDASTSASISTDGRYVTFESVAANPGAASSVSSSGIFLRDTCAGAAACTPSTQQLR